MLDGAYECLYGDPDMLTDDTSLWYRYNGEMAEYIKVEIEDHCTATIRQYRAVLRHFTAYDSRRGASAPSVNAAIESIRAGMAEMGHTMALTREPGLEWSREGRRSLVWECLAEKEYWEELDWPTTVHFMQGTCTDPICGHTMSTDQCDHNVFPEFREYLKDHWGLDT